MLAEQSKPIGTRLVLRNEPNSAGTDTEAS